MTCASIINASHTTQRQRIILYRSHIPVFRCLTPGPVLTTVPAASCPITIGASTENLPHLPVCQYFKSEPQMPTEPIRNKTSDQTNYKKMYMNKLTPVQKSV